MGRSSFEKRHFLRVRSGCDNCSPLCRLVTLWNSDGDSLVWIKLVFKLPALSPPLLSSSMITFCPDCGKNIKAAFRFCPYCGKPLPTEEHEESQTFVRPLVSPFRGKDRVLSLISRRLEVPVCVHLGRKGRCLCSLSDPLLILEKPTAQAL